MLLGFKEQFEEKILAKLKRHTIRGRRKGKRQIRVGDRLDCYVDSRQKSMRLLGRWPCTRVQNIHILQHKKDSRAHILIDGYLLSADECEMLSRADGFPNFASMMQFWKGRLPFRGVMIHWNPDQPQPGPKKGKRK